MAIELMVFNPPLQVRDQSEIDLETAALFAKKQDVPADFKKELTPEGYRDRYILRTRSVPRDEGDETVGEIEVINNGAKMSAVEGNRFSGEFKVQESEEKTMKRAVNEDNPMVVIARPNELDGKEGIRVDRIIRYVRS